VMAMHQGRTFWYFIALFLARFCCVCVLAAQSYLLGFLCTTIMHLENRAEALSDISVGV
jgi:hypothetical protein